MMREKKYFLVCISFYEYSRKEEKAKVFANNITLDIIKNTFVDSFMFHL